MTTAADFFSLGEQDVPRARNGNPLLVPEALEGREPVVRSEYSRASGLAGAIEEKDHIHTWQMRLLAKAMGQNEDLAALAAIETYSTGLETESMSKEELRAYKTLSGRRLDGIIERALDRVRIHEKADRGTAVHGFTEPGAPDGAAIPERLRDPVAAFWEINTQECIEIVGTEMFTANDTTMSAGTFDHLVRVVGHPELTGLVIGDKKTGRFDPLSWVVQLSTYANGKVYDCSSDRRLPWPGEINADYGLVWQIDCTEAGDSKEGRVKPWVIDLKVGWELAQIAARVRDIAADEDSLASAFRSPTFEKRLSMCHTLDDLRVLWKSLDPEDPRMAEVTKKAEGLQ